MSGPDPLAGREIFIETITLDDLKKLNIIDVETGVEVSVFGPLKTAQEDLQRVGLRKLARRLGLTSALDADDGKPPPNRRRGLIV
ncbi:MAG: serine hydroxymethyltransferase [Maricaulaceae bacterium]